MPLIQRIEISNFLNSGRIEPWRPDWPHQVFNLNAENTAMNIPNGKGKSSLILSILSMLTGNMRPLNNIRNRHYSPRRTGRYTHIRLEVLVTLPGEGSNDLVSMAGGDLAGSPMVFGLFGNSGENERVSFYAYRGKLEDCKIANVHEMRHDLVTDKDFLESLNACAGVLRDPSQREWLAYLDDHFDLSNLRQQFVYQMARGAEGDSNYFEARIPGKSYAASIFYERLAPELLSEVMGQLGEDDERGIEDTIHEKVSKIIVAKRNTAKKAEELERAEGTLKELETALQIVQSLVNVEDEYKIHRAEFATEVAAVKNVLIDAPILGVPVNPPEHIPLASTMVMQSPEGNWYLPDRAMAGFTGEEVRAVNQRARDRNGISLTQENYSQVIDFTCDLKVSARKKGHANQLYSRDSAIALLNVTAKFTHDWSRDKAINAVTQAFDWVELNADTNPARKLDQQISQEIEKSSTHRKDLSQKITNYVSERDELRKEQQTIGEQQSEYRKMVDSGLFTEAELLNPAQTNSIVEAEYSSADTDLNLHKDKIRDLKNVYAHYKTFITQHGNTINPKEYAEILIHDAQVAKDAEKEIDVQLKEARLNRQPLKTALINAEKAQSLSNNKHTKYIELSPNLKIYNRLFGDKPATGLEAVVKDALKEAKDRRHQIEVALSSMERSLSSLARFRALNGDADPASWITTRLKEWEAVGIEISKLQELKVDAELRRADLDKTVVAPGHVAREALVAAGGMPRPLHAVIDEMGLSAARKEAVLTLFSALLHAPVYRTLSEAAEAASKLADKEIESPVFVREELASFCQAEAEIPIENSIAHTWLVGVRTRPVDCLLDPSLVEREKVQLDARIRLLVEQIEQSNKHRDLLAADHPDAADAPAAAQAVSDGLEPKHAALLIERSHIDTQLPRLKDQASEEAVNAIRAKIEFSRSFSDNDNEENLSAESNAAKTLFKDAESVHNENEVTIESLELKRDNLVTSRANAEQQAKQVPGLESLQAFMDHQTDNPTFMQSAESTEEALTQKLRNATKRKNFRFELAESFVKSGDDRPRWIENRIKAINSEIVEIQDRLLPQLDKDIESLHNRGLDIKTKTGMIDSLVQTLYRKYREFLTEDDLIQNLERDGTIINHPILDLADAIREEVDVHEQVARLIDLVEDIDVVDASALSKKMRESRQKYLSAKNALANHIDIMLVKPNLDLSEHVRIELQRSKEDVSIIQHIYGVTKTNYEKNSAANATAQSYLDQEWGNIGGWLQKFTLRLPDNLRIMREIFAPERDKKTQAILRAGFDISAKIADKQDIQSTLNDIVQLVEKYENNSETIGQFAPGGKAKVVSNLRREIRNNFYQKVLLEPIIRVCMPSISQKPLPLEKDMVSTGQGVAMALLWIVKMASYVSERELARQTVSSAQLKRLKSNKTQFTIIDGAFSSLSNKELINDALNSVAKNRGNFQLIITGHDENYQNNFTYFPSLIVAREVNGKYMYADSNTRRLLPPNEVGSHYGAMGVMNLRVQPITETSGQSLS